MYKAISFLLFVLFFTGIHAQTENVLDDFRQYNLTNINSSLLNPTFSFDRNNPRVVSFWTRWQWQTPDADPTTLFLNYTQKLGSQAAGGIGFFQNSTGAFQNTGGILNFSFAIPLDQEGQSNLFFGTNVSLFQQEALNDSVANAVGDSFIGQFSPGVRIQAGGFNMALSIENALNFNFSDSERDDTNRIFGTLMSYDFPVILNNEKSYIRPQAYVRSSPDTDIQYGLVALLQNPKFWIQGGYNNFYGSSGGAGITLFKKLSVGALVEFGIDGFASDQDPSFEIIASYHFGKQGQEEVNEEDEEPKLSGREQRRLEKEQREEAERLEEMRRDSIQRAQEEQKWEEWNKMNNDSLAKLEEERRLEEAKKLAEITKAREDSIAEVREAEIRRELEKAKQDSIARIEAQRREEKPQPNEKYQEVSSSEGLDPGYYLIANVFGTQRYYEKFMETLRNSGLEPKSFRRSLNGFNYVYLDKYNTLGEARAARNSNFNGLYSGDLWIFRVR